LPLFGTGLYIWGGINRPTISLKYMIGHFWSILEQDFCLKNDAFPLLKRVSISLL